MEQKTCLDCEYYVQHYRYADSRIKETSCGDCRFEKVRHLGGRIVPCGSFKDNTERKEKLKTSVSDKLDRIAQEIEGIKVIISGK